jgi:hypothetical protein
MMQYSAIRSKIRTGDIFAVEGRGLIGAAIRVLTGQQFSHVAMLLDKGPGGVWVAEFVEGVGYQQMPASEWLKPRVGKRQYVYWGCAPHSVRTGSADLFVFVNRFRPENGNTRYSYWTLLTVWWSQITRRQQRGKYVCSTFVQRAWESVGYRRFTQLADPGDFLHHCLSVTHLEAL